MPTTREMSFVLFVVALACVAAVIGLWEFASYLFDHISVNVEWINDP